MAEHSGIGYELFSDMDRIKGGGIGLQNSFSIANAIRWALPSNKNGTIYKSSCILGHGTFTATHKPRNRRQHAPIEFCMCFLGLFLGPFVFRCQFGGVL